jgi:hypothetical protein
MSRQGSNDQRSDVRNPNNPAYKTDLDNRANQMNPNHAASKNRSVAADRVGVSARDAQSAQSSRSGQEGGAAMQGMDSEGSPPGRIPR